MAEVVSNPHGYTKSIGNSRPAALTVEMPPAPDFSFPSVEPLPSQAIHRRPLSMNMTAAPPRTTEISHRRGASALPGFSFNATDTSGLTGDDSEEDEADPVSTPTTPSRGSHKRNTSEFVGGLGMNGAISSSPTRSSALTIPRVQHRSNHSRSRVTLSSHDLSAIISPPEPQPRLSSSLPNTPLEFPTLSTNNETRTPGNQVFGPPLEDVPVRPPSRPRVGFSENVEYIPRPLSTISSETGSSMSTVRGHSVSNSISSVLSLSTPSPPSARVRATSLGTTLEHESRTAPKSSLEISRRVEREGQWLRTGSISNSLARPHSESASQPPNLTFVEAGLPVSPSRIGHQKKRSVSDSLGFDRRKSEPVLNMYGGEPPRHSALSLQEHVAGAPDSIRDVPVETDYRSSSRKLKDWAVSKLSRKSKDWSRPASRQSTNHKLVPLANDNAVSEAVVAETDLDAVFSLDTDTDTLHGRSVRAQPVGSVGNPFFTPHRRPPSDGNDDGTMLDLDAALDPFRTTDVASQRPRRELHSSRGTKDFVGPGGHYLPDPSHRRTESAPMLTAFDQTTVSASQTAMADVFEEDEEEIPSDRSDPSRSASLQSIPDDEAGMGVQIVDSDLPANCHTAGMSLDDDLRTQHGHWEAERPTTSYGTVSSRLSTPILDRHSSVIEDTIMEETSPVEPAIVEYHEEPRAQSLTKSSDSSETPTILATQSGMLALPDGQHSYEASTYPSPDCPRRQGSFDTSRVGTSASSIADTRTMSSCATGEPAHDVRISVDDVPSLTSSRSTMVSTMHANSSRRDISGARTPSVTSGALDPAVASERRRKRASIQSLSQFVGGSFGPRQIGTEEGRPQTAAEMATANQTPKKKEHRIKKLMFWKSKHRQASAMTNS